MPDPFYDGAHMHKTDEGEVKFHTETDQHEGDEAREAHERTRKWTRKEEGRSKTFIIRRPW